MSVDLQHKSSRLSWTALQAASVFLTPALRTATRLGRVLADAPALGYWLSSIGYSLRYGLLVGGDPANALVLGQAGLRPRCAHRP